MQIYKYEVPWERLGQSFVIAIPKGGLVRALQVQDGEPRLWVEVDTEAEMQVRHFMVIGTGHTIPHGLTYIGTWQDPPFVWHLYEDHPTA